MSDENTQSTESAENVDTTAETTAENGGREKTFTQEELNEIVQKRVAKYSDYNEIKEAHEALKTEIETLKANSGQALDTAREEARTEGRNEVLATANKRIAQAETRALAMEMGFHYPADAHLYIDLDSVDGEDGPDVEKIKAALTAVVEERPALVKSDGSDIAAHDAGLGVQGGAPKKSSTDIVDALFA